MEVVGEAAGGEEAVNMAQRLTPDVVIMDVLIPVKSGIEASREIVEALADTRVLMLTAPTSAIAVAESVAAGADGYRYLVKSSIKVALLDSVRAVVTGTVSIPDDLLKRAHSEVDSGAKSSAVRTRTLTLREWKIVKMFAQGLSNSEIALRRGNKPLAIRNSIYAIQTKVGSQKQAGSCHLGRAEWTVGRRIGHLLTPTGFTISSYL